MEIEIPAVPAGVLTLLAFFSTYAIAALNAVLPFVKKSWQKKAVTIVFAAALAGLVIVFYWAMTGEPLPSWPVFVILSLLIISSSYALFTGKSASKVEESIASTDKSEPTQGSLP